MSEKDKMKLKKIISNDKGAVLVTGLMFLLFLTIIGATALMSTTNDITISANYKSVKEAFYNAEGGVHLAVTAIENGVNDGSFAMPAVGSEVDLQTAIGSAIPSNYNISLGSLAYAGENKYLLTSTGRSGIRGATSTIQAFIRRGSAFEYAAFGDKKLDADSNVKFYSYSSDEDPGTPTNGATDSTHEADIGSNGVVDLDSSIVDGDVKLGESSGTTATTNYSPTPSIYGEDGEEVGPVPVDPLGMLTEIPDLFNTYTMSNNDNADAAGINASPNEFLLDNGQILYGKAGGANYYFEEINVGAGNSININASAGPVNVFINGPINFSNSAALNILGGTKTNKINIYVTEPPSSSYDPNDTLVQFDNGAIINMDGPPTSFGFYSDTDAKIVIRNDAAFKGVVYAPQATVDIKANGGIYGSLWGSEVLVNNDTDIYYDTALQNQYFSKDILLTGWMQVME